MGGTQLGRRETKTKRCRRHQGKVTAADTEFISAWLFIQELSDSCLKDMLVPCKNELRGNEDSPEPSRSNGSTTGTSPQLSDGTLCSQRPQHTLQPSNTNTCSPRAVPRLRMGRALISLASPVCISHQGWGHTQVSQLPAFGGH